MRCSSFWRRAGLAAIGALMLALVVPMPRAMAATPTPWDGVGSTARSLYPYTNTLLGAYNTRLDINSYITSNNVMYVLILQNDGNLVLYGNGNGTAMWNSGTYGSGANRLVMQNDGNLVLYKANGAWVWQTHTYGKGPANAVLDEDGNFKVVRNDGSVTWSTNTGGHPRYGPFIGSVGTSATPWYMATGETLTPNHYLRSSRQALLFQPDGNLVLYGPGYHVLWNSGTYGSGADHLVMQNDGNLVLYKANGAWVWQTHTYGKGASHAWMDESGNFAVATNIHPNQWTWSTQTTGRV